MSTIAKDARDTTAAMDSLHSKFRHILALLIFATAYNSGSLPILRKHDEALLNDSSFNKLSTLGVLNALATLFVRGNEIVAVTNITPTVVVSAMVSDGSIPGKAFASTHNARKGDKKHKNYIAPGVAVVPTGDALNLDLSMDEEAMWKYLYQSKT